MRPPELYCHQKGSSPLMEVCQQQGHPRQGKEPKNCPAKRGVKRAEDTLLPSMPADRDRMHTLCHLNTDDKDARQVRRVMRPRPHSVNWAGTLFARQSMGMHTMSVHRDRDTVAICWVKLPAKVNSADIVLQLKCQRFFDNTLTFQLVPLLGSLSMRVNFVFAHCWSLWKLLDDFGLRFSYNIIGVLYTFKTF